MHKNNAIDQFDCDETANIKTNLNNEAKCKLLNANHSLNCEFSQLWKIDNVVLTAENISIKQLIN